MDAFSSAQLTDALSRGRLAPAEIAAIPPRELEALFETAARCLDGGRDTEAVHLLGGLVTLFPFSARYWRAYAIALHRRLQIGRARAAYEASLAFEPDHAITRCYRCEILIYLGRADEARAELTLLLTSDDPSAAERAAQLLRQIDSLSAWRPPRPDEEPERTHPAADRPRFTLDDERDLPLEPSRFDDAIAPTGMREEITRTARIFAPISDEPTAPMGLPEEVTDTAVLRRRGQTEPGLPVESSITGTALLPGRKGRPPAPEPQPVEGSATALLPGRRGRAWAPAGEPTEAVNEEPTLTNLLDEEPTLTQGLGEEPTLTNLLDEEPTLTRGLDEPDELDAAAEPTLTAVTLRRDGRLTFDGEDD